MNERITKLCNWLNENEYTGAFLTSTENVFHLTHFYCEPHERLLALLVLPNEAPILICPQMEVNRAKGANFSGEIIGYDDIEKPFEKLKKAVEKQNVTLSSLAIETSSLSYERSLQLRAIFKDVSFYRVEEKMNELRMIKDANEIKSLQQAAALADRAVEIGVASIQEGKTELEIIAAIEFEMKRLGVASMSFPTMVLTGDNASDPHGVPGQTPIKKGDFVLFDLGVIVDGYCSDISRTVAFGDVTKKQQRIYEIVKEAQQKAIDQLAIGVPLADIDQAARSHITHEGYGEYFPHRLGHGLGIGLHEYPNVSSASTLTLTPGMVFTIEPGIYVPHVAGVRIEDDVWISKEGPVVLTSYPKHLITVK